MRFKLFNWLLPFIMSSCIGGAALAQPAPQPIQDQASQINTDTSQFDNNLSAADNTVQKALNTLDEVAGGPGGGTWGTITGTLSNQTDLQNALDAKVPTSRSIGTTAPLTGGGALTSNLILGITQANGSSSGYLSSTDWTTFNNKQNTASLETDVEAVVDLQDLQGAVTDPQVPNNITIDNATTAANLGADGVDALTEIAQGIKTAANDTSALVVGTAGSTNEIAKWDASGNLVDGNVIFGTMTDGRYCRYTTAGTLIDCNRTCADITGGAGLCDGTDDGGGGSPGGASPQIQFNNGGVFDGVAGSGADTNGNIGIGTTGPTSKVQVVGTMAATTVTGANVTSGADPGHTHTTTSVSGIDISADTNLTAGDALTITDDDIDFDGGASPAGELGGTWASPTIDATHSGSAHHSAVTVSGTPNYITLSGQDIVRGEVALGTHTSGGYAASTTEGGGATSLEADGVDALTEIAQGIKTAANDTSALVVGTAGSNGEIAKWNTDGTLTDANVIFGTLSNGQYCKYTTAGTLIDCNVTCTDITGSAALCDGNDASGGAATAGGGDKNIQFNNNTVIDGGLLTGIDANGNVGIGTVNPSTTFELVKSSDRHPLMVSATPTGDGNYMIITSNGNVGIGTSSPQRILDIKGSSPELKLIDSNASGYAAYRIFNGTTNMFKFEQSGPSSADGGLAAMGTIANNAFEMVTNDTRRIRIQANGNIGIGTVDPSTSFVVGTVPASQLTVTSSGVATFPAGSASAGSWPKFTSGTVMTTAEDGAVEVDDNTFYHTTDAGNRGYVPAVHIIRADATRTFTSNTSQQAIFTTPANGRLTLETGAYLFDCLIGMDTMSGTSGNGKFAVNSGGTATLGSILWHAWGQDLANEATGAATGGSGHTIAIETGTNVITAGTATEMFFQVKGTFEVTGAGTIIPSFAQTTAAAAVVKIGSYCQFNRIGSTSLTNVGQWD